VPQPLGQHGLQIIGQPQPQIPQPQVVPQALGPQIPQPQNVPQDPGQQPVVAQQLLGQLPLVAQGQGPAIGHQQVPPPIVLGLPLPNFQQANQINLPGNTLRRSPRSNKGVPPLRYDAHF